MKTIGLIGGTSWESTVDYYRLLNEGVRARLGGFHSVKLLLSSVDFADYESWMRAGQWDHLGAALALEAGKLQAAGADILLLGTNTMHKKADSIRAALSAPFLDIRDVTAQALLKAGCRMPLLLGTGYTMRDDFFTAHLAQAGLTPKVPNTADQAEINRIIFEELVKGKVLPGSRARALDIIARSEGVDGVIFGCTEIGMLLKPDDLAIQSFDTMRLHVEAALEFAL